MFFVFQSILHNLWSSLYTNICDLYAPTLGMSGFSFFPISYRKNYKNVLNAAYWRSKFLQQKRNQNNHKFYFR